MMGSLIGRTLILRKQSEMELSLVSVSKQLLGYMSKICDHSDENMTSNYNSKDISWQKYL